MPQVASRKYLDDGNDNKRNTGFLYVGMVITLNVVGTPLTAITVIGIIQSPV